MTVRRIALREAVPDDKCEGKKLHHARLCWPVLGIRLSAAISAVWYPAPSSRGSRENMWWSMLSIRPALLAM